MKKISKAAKRRLTIFGTVSVLAVLYFSINLFGYAVKIINLRNAEAELVNRLETLKEESKDLESEITKLHDPEYIARYARENYQYSKTGEYIIQINDDKKEVEVEQAEKDYTVLFLSTIITLSITIIIKKISHI